MKIVTVTKETKLVYEVESGTGALSDDQAIDTVKARIEADMPQGLKSEESKITNFEVREAVRGD